MSRKLKLLDLFSGSGGSAMGYHRAGFDVTGVDHVAQPRYPFQFVLADALEYVAEHGREYDAIHASPPCQRFTSLNAMWNHRTYPDLVGPTREALQAAGRPWVIENVPGAPLRSPIILCGSMFGLGTGDAELRRHRLFETSFGLVLVPPCNHGWKAQTIAVYGHSGGWSRRVRASVIGVYGGHGRDRRRRMNGQNFPTASRREAMGISWMMGTELSQAIPPAYTEFVGAQLLSAVRAQEGG